MPSSKGLPWWPDKARDDPVLKLATQLGFKVKYYDAPPAPWHKLPRESLNLNLFICGVMLFLWLNRGSSGLVRQFAGITAILTMISWPVIYGRTGLGLVDFGVPAYAFLTTLHFTDLFIIRGPADTKDWSYRKMFAEAMTFPKEEQSPNPRWENVKVLGLCFVKYLAVNFMLYAAPSEEIIRTVNSPLAWVLYHSVIGACILGTLGFLIEGTMRLIGLILGVEQNYLFQNPLMATNLRLFWARWNMVIKDGLHRVIFSAKQKKKEQDGGKPNRPKNGQKYSHKDHLSETEMSSAQSGPDARRQAVVDARKTQRKKGKFLPKAVSALLTFAFSGLFHEYMNHLAFDGASGENLAFFMLHGTLVVCYVWLSRNTPGLLKHIPSIVGILIVNSITFGTSPLFCRPFVRANFFEQMKVGGLIAGPIRGFVYFFGQ